MNLLIVFLNVWVLSTGETIDLPCAPESEWGEAVKMPTGCPAQEPGVWLSVERYKALRAAEAAQLVLNRCPEHLVECEQRKKSGNAWWSAGGGCVLCGGAAALGCMAK